MNAQHILTVHNGEAVSLREYYHREIDRLEAILPQSEEHLAVLEEKAERLYSELAAMGKE